MPIRRHSPNTNTPDQFRLSDDEHEAIFRRYIVPLLSSAKPTETPVAVIFGGQPGSGKSAAVNVAASSLMENGGCVQIIGDDFRGYHPKYAELMARDDKTAAYFTDRDTARWIEKSIAYVLRMKVNVVIEGTMRNHEKVAETMQNFRSAGYLVEARAMAVNERISWMSVLMRYEYQRFDRGTGRMTTPEAHQAGYIGMLETLDRIENERLADVVTILGRGGATIYRKILNDIGDSSSLRIKDVVEAERARPLNPDERKDYISSCHSLLGLLERKERNATMQEKNRHRGHPRHHIREERHELNEHSPSDC
ncbi:MAG: zeta toxin of the postsegregational killing system [Rhodospirillales bacterium]|nr:MAG: zeta toxin of the postsegregational killing system [Rhodospirillales bacterium]